MDKWSQGRIFSLMNGNNSLGSTIALSYKDQTRFFNQTFLAMWDIVLGQLKIKNKSLTLKKSSKQIENWKGQYKFPIKISEKNTGIKELLRNKIISIVMKVEKISALKGIQKDQSVLFGLLCYKLGQKLKTINRAIQGICREEPF